MHIHPNQLNPYSQLDAMQSAQKSQAKAAAERTRKKLMQSASELAGRATEEAYIVEVESSGDSGRYRREPQKRGRPGAGTDDPQSEDGDRSVEDWV